MSRRGRRWALLLVVAFVVVPLLELYVLIQVGQVIGVWWTILLLVLDSIFGGWLIKREGARAWRALRAAIDQGRMPARELADGVLIVLGGAFMLSPGFVTDALGILLILPLTRPLFRRLLTSYAAGRATGFAVGHVGGRPHTDPRTAPRTDQSPGPTVVRGEVIDDGTD